MQDLTITLFQADLVWEDIDANLAHFDEGIDALTAPTDLIVLPEMFSTGFSMNAPALAEDMQGKAVSWLRSKAREKKTVITGSVMIRESGR
jgi:omega-amidase